MSTPNGPQPGSTPSYQDELRGNGDNPYSAGSPAVDLTDTTDQHFSVFGSNTPGAYYLPPAITDATNAYSQGAGKFTSGESSLGSAIGDGADDAHDQTLITQTGGDAPDPNGSDAYQRQMRIDTGQDDQLVPPAQWK